MMSTDLQFNYAEILVTQGKLSDSQTNINNTEYRYGTIETENSFLDNLRFMGPPHHWFDSNSEKPITEEGKIYNSITGIGGHDTARLRRIVLGIVKKYGGSRLENPSQMLYRLGKANDWYKRFLAIEAYFDRRLLEPLWVRNWGDRQSLYIEDGNARSLAYALRLACKTEKYQPIPIIWCRSWSHVFSWADNYENDPNADENYGSPASIEGIVWK